MNHRRISVRAGRVAVLGALPLAVAIVCAGTGSAAPLQTAIEPAAESAPGPSLPLLPALAVPASMPLALNDIAAPPGPDMAKVNEAALAGAGVGAVAGGVPGAVVGGLGGAAAGAVVGAGAGFLVGVGTVAAGTFIAAMVGCATTGCVITVPVFVAGLAAQAITAGPAMAIGGALGAGVGGALGAAAVGIPSAAVGAGIGAGIGAGAAAAGFDVSAPPLPQLG